MLYFTSDREIIQCKAVLKPQRSNLSDNCWRHETDIYCDKDLHVLFVRDKLAGCCKTTEFLSEELYQVIELLRLDPSGTASDSRKQHRKPYPTSAFTLRYMNSFILFHDHGSCHKDYTFSGTVLGSRNSGRLENSGRIRLSKRHRFFDWLLFRLGSDSQSCPTIRIVHMKMRLIWLTYTGPAHEGCRLHCLF
jgi:hypothetical protein